MTSSASGFTVCTVFTNLEPSNDVPTNVGVFIPSGTLFGAEELVFESATHSASAVVEPLDPDVGGVIGLRLAEPLEPDTNYEVYADGRTYVADINTTSGSDAEPPEPMRFERVRGERGRIGDSNALRSVPRAAALRRKSRE
jgi:hypothetical protein